MFCPAVVNVFIFIRAPGKTLPHPQQPPPQSWMMLSLSTPEWGWSWQHDQDLVQGCCFLSFPWSWILIWFKSVAKPSLLSVGSGLSLSTQDAWSWYWTSVHSLLDSPSSPIPASFQHNPKSNHLLPAGNNWLTKTCKCSSPPVLCSMWLKIASLTGLSPTFWGRDSHARFKKWFIIWWPWQQPSLIEAVGCRWNGNAQWVSECMITPSECTAAELTIILISHIFDSPLLTKPKVISICLLERKRLLKSVSVKKKSCCICN